MRFLQQSRSFICFYSKLSRSLPLFLLLFLCRPWGVLPPSTRPPAAVQNLQQASNLLRHSCFPLISPVPCLVYLRMLFFFIVSPSSSTLVRVVSFEFLSLSIISHPTYIFIFNVGSSGTPRGSSADHEPSPFPPFPPLPPHTPHPLKPQKDGTHREKSGPFFLFRKSLNSEL